MYYYSIFQWHFKFIFRYRFEKKVEKYSGDRYRKSSTAIRQLKGTSIHWFATAFRTWANSNW